jgi:hypothetical protein
MPQLDVSTYLGQVTWFAVVFAVFYLIVLTDVLPGLNRALKVRTKKLERVRGDARQFDGVRVASEDKYADLVGSYARTLGSFVNDRLAVTQSSGRALVLRRFRQVKRVRR